MAIFIRRPLIQFVDLINNINRIIFQKIVQHILGTYHYLDILRARFRLYILHANI